MTEEPRAAGWPVADFDPVRRLRVVAAAGRGNRITETVLDQPFERVWALAQDLERTMPLWIPDVRTVRLGGPPDAQGRPTAEIRGHTRLRATFAIDLRPGWCLMQSRFVLGGMAARALADGTTHFAFLGGLRVPCAGALLTALRPFTGSPLARFEALLDAA
ncbi:hypothetical protein GCM10009665_52490 [Kitasatospora nipponensis]|uniref:Polyketide cyclase/dehydrase/lipid transport protein n=1 Tax=Kitasatospora nipponensis TaxID=258049 RepID=A0ABP4H9X3_9ACTN